MTEWSWGSRSYSGSSAGKNDSDARNG